MRNYTYNFEIETMITMFISAMDNIIVKRYNKDKVAEDQIKVRFVYAPKQRVLLDLVDKAQNIELPVVAVTNGGITRDANRVFNKILGSYLTTPDVTKSNKLLQPVPIDLTINMDILTRYQQDYDQIITNFAPYFDPYIVISWRPPAYPDYEIRSVVSWSGNVTTTYPTDVSNTQVARIQGTTSFTFKGWLFKATPQGGGDKNILTIIADMSTEPGIHTKYRLQDLDPTTTERLTLSAIPQLKIVSPITINKGVSGIFTLVGESLTRIKNVYLSGSNINSTFFNPFSAISRLSADNPGFSAVVLPSSSYTTNNTDTMIINLPELSASGYYDIIVQNPAGYNTLTRNALSGVGSFRVPYKDGIKVI